MAQRTYYTSPATKNLYVYEDFSKGMNTVSSVSQMMDSESALILNMDLDERGSVRRRSGMVVHQHALETEGTAQGFFRHYINQYTFHELIAKNGRLEVNNVDAGISFQKTRPIEAVQYHDKTYLATGSGLYVYDGTEVTKVIPHRPQPLEALYIGTNALADDPNNYLDNAIGSTVMVNGVTFDKRYGIMNEPFTMTAYSTKLADTTLEFQFEYRYPWQEDGVYILGRDWSTEPAWSHTPVGEGDMQFRVNARQVGSQTAQAQYLVPKYKVKPQEDMKDITPSQGGIQTCNRILLHWDRLLLYGDTENTNTLYMSHLKKPTFFPVPNHLQFETKKKEAITAAVRFRDFLIVLTDTSVQALYGKSPQDYRRSVLNTSVGCIAPKGATVMDNYVVFMSLDGIYYLKSVGYQEDKANVAPLDVQVANRLPRSRDCVLEMYEDQLHAVFPTDKVRFRYHKMLGAWVQDTSPYLDMTSLQVFDVDFYGQRANGQVMRFRKDIYSDNNFVYVAEMHTKFQDFKMPFHDKKLKELQLTAAAGSSGQKATMQLVLDGKDGLQQVLDYEAEVGVDPTYTTFVDKVRATGKCYRVQLRITHDEDEYFSLASIAYIVKAKKP